MTQQNVFNLLKKKKKWMAAKEIAACLKINQGNVNVSLSKLYKQKEILRKVLGKKSGFFRSGDAKPYYWRAK